MELAADSVALSGGDVPVYKCACELCARVGVYASASLRARTVSDICHRSKERSPGVKE